MDSILSANAQHFEARFRSKLNPNIGKLGLLTAVIRTGLTGVEAAWLKDFNEDFRL